MVTCGVLAIIWFASSWALFRPGFFRVHDFVHAARIAEITRAATEGQFPIRWSANFDRGYGMPLFEFYAPLPYYVGGFLWWLGMPMVLILKILWGGCSALTLLGAYLLGKTWFRRSAGIVAAAALTLAPYRAVNLFVRGALSESWGIMAMPWVLYGLTRIIRGQKFGWLVLSLSVTTLCLSHNLMTILFLPLAMLFGFGLLLIERPQDFWRKAFSITGSVALGVGLAGYYLIPAFLEKDLTKVAQITGGYFDYHLHFLYIRQFLQSRWGYGGSNWGPDDGISFFLGWGQLLGLVFSVVIMGRSIDITRELMKKKSWTSQAIWTKIKAFFLHKSSPLLTYGLLGVLTVVSVGMTIGRSSLVWDLIPALEFVQFPWRWLGPGVVFMSLLLAVSVSRLESIKQRYLYVAVLVVVMVVGNARYFRPETVLADPSGLYATDPGSIQTWLSEVLNDYVPIQMPHHLELVPPTAVAFLGEKPVTSEQILINRGHEKLITVSPVTETLLTWSIADFPGWKVAIDGKAALKERVSFGLIGVVVPPGEHKVSVQWQDTPIRFFGDLVTVLTAIIFLGLLMPYLMIMPKGKRD